MPKQVRAPNGDIINFPDNMADAQISIVMQKKYGRQSPQSTMQSAAKSALFGAAQGLTFNTGDETAGKIARNNWENRQQGKALGELLSGKPQNALRRMQFVYGNQGQPYKQSIQNAATSTARQQIAKAQQDHPGWYYGGMVAGGLAPIGAVNKVVKAPRAITLGAKVGRGIVEGAIQGGLYGAGDATSRTNTQLSDLVSTSNGDDGATTFGDRLEGARQGAIFGGITGGLIPTVGAGVGKVASRIKANVPLAKPNPASMPNSLIYNAFKGDAKGVANKINQLKKAGVPNPTLVDINPKLAKQVGSFARIDAGGQAREIAANRASDMLNQVPSAASRMMRTKTGVQQTGAQIEDALTKAKLRKQNALITPIENSPYAMSNIQQKILASPNVRGATGETADILDTIAATRGETSPEAQGLRDIINNRPPPNQISLRSIEQLRRRLGDQVNNAYQSGNKSLGRDLGAVQDSFMQPVREAFPAYDKALNIGNLAKSQIDAMDVGANDIFNAQTPDVVERLANMSSREQRGFRQGAANQMTQKVMDDKNNFDLLRRMAAGQDFTNKLGEVFGQDAAQGMQEGAQALNQRVAAARAINPNYGSQTAENLSNDTQNIASIVANPKLKAIDYANKFLSLPTLGERYRFIDMATRQYTPEQLESIFTAHETALKQGLAPDWVTYLFQNQAAQMGGRNYQ